ncbi:MAG: hypothetical protein PHR26_03920 [Candidatus ainarchaeum sp.]|nr:hypothetical protein [Candidatus ainarchaeum sp.]MDD3976272.1 hypothetical protein [Candidatus ainarchaeum sp.]
MNYKKYLIPVIFAILIISLFSVNLFAETIDYDIINLNADNYTYSPTPVISGDEFELWIQLTNNSNTVAENIEYILELEYPFSLLENNENIGTIKQLAPHQTKVIKYDLKTSPDALDRTYNLNFKYKRNGFETYTIKNIEIDVSGDNAIVDIISSNIETAEIGKNSEVSLTIKNLGGKNAKDIFITLDNSEDTYINILDLKTKYIENLEIGSEQIIKFRINVSKNASLNSYTLPITIEYKDNDGNYETNRNIGIEIIDNPEIITNILSVGENYKLKANSTEKISLEIYNIGNVDAESVYINLISDIANAPSYFIGSIEKDNYDSIELDLQTRNITLGEYNITLEVYYKDRNLKEQMIQKEITIEIVSQTGAKSGVTSVISIIFGILGFIIGLSILVLLLKWLTKILIKPALKEIKGIFRKKK